MVYTKLLLQCIRLLRVQVLFVDVKWTAYLKQWTLLRSINIQSVKYNTKITDSDLRKNCEIINPLKRTDYFKSTLFHQEIRNLRRERKTFFFPILRKKNSPCDCSSLSSVNRLVFVKNIYCVFCVGGTEIINTIQINFRLQRLNLYLYIYIVTEAFNHRNVSDRNFTRGSLFHKRQ